MSNEIREEHAKRLLKEFAKLLECLWSKWNRSQRTNLVVIKTPWTDTPTSNLHCGNRRYGEEV